MSKIQRELEKYNEKRKKNIRSKGPKWMTEYCEGMIVGLTKGWNPQEILELNPTLQYILRK